MARTLGHRPQLDSRCGDRSTAKPVAASDRTAFSVEQILQAWKRRGHPIRHFNSEFERIILGPVDPTASKYAPMTTASPSEMMAAAPAPTTTASPELSVSAATVPEQTTDTPRPLDSESPLSSSPPIDRTQTTADPVDPSAIVDSQETKPSGSDPSATTLGPTTFDQPSPIRQFVPATETSQFYQRLQSVPQQSP